MTHSIRTVILASGFIVAGIIGLTYVLFLSEAIPLTVASASEIALAIGFGWLYSDLFEAPATDQQNSSSPKIIVEAKKQNIISAPRQCCRQRGKISADVAVRYRQCRATAP
jgi:hypothetical protein